MYADNRDACPRVAAPYYSDQIACLFGLHLPTNKYYMLVSLQCGAKRFDLGLKPGAQRNRPLPLKHLDIVRENDLVAPVAEDPRKAAANIKILILEKPGEITTDEVEHRRKRRTNPVEGHW
jgi:hypothetical protein